MKNKDISGKKLYKYKGIFDCFEAKIKPSLFWIFRQYYTNYIEALYYEITRRTSAGSCIVWRRQPWRKVPTFRYIFLINDPSLVSSNYFLNIHCAYSVVLLTGKVIIWINNFSKSILVYL